MNPNILSLLSLTISSQLRLKSRLWFSVRSEKQNKPFRIRFLESFLIYCSHKCLYATLVIRMHCSLLLFAAFAQFCFYYSFNQSYFSCILILTYFNQSYSFPISKCWNSAHSSHFTTAIYLCSHTWSFLLAFYPYTLLFCLKHIIHLLFVLNIRCLMQNTR